MNALRRRILKLATLLGALTALFACNAPFIPVPPPGASFTSELVDDGAGGEKPVWVTHGLPSQKAALATYFVKNQRTGAGIIATAGDDGAFTGTPMDGAEGDQVILSYRTPEGDYSDSLCLLLTESVEANGSAPSCRP